MPRKLEPGEPFPELLTRKYQGQLQVIVSDDNLDEYWDLACANAEKKKHPDVEKFAVYRWTVSGYRLERIF